MPATAHRDELLRKRVDLFARMLPGIEQADVRALHRGRVATRRLRELLPVLELDGATARKLSRRLRKATGLLGRVRELDVLALLVEELRRGAAADARTLDRLERRIEDRRAAARSDLLDSHTLDMLRRLGRRLSAALDALTESDAGERGRAAADRHWRWAIEARVTRRAANLRRAVHAAGIVYSADRLHDVRIALKKLRYAMELDAEMRGLRMTPDVRTLRAEQALLGRLHDLQMLIAEARAAAGDTVTEHHGLDRLIDTLEIECRHLHARYVAERSALLSITDRAGRRPAARARGTAPIRRKAG